MFFTKNGRAELMSNFNTLLPFPLILFYSTTICSCCRVLKQKPLMQGSWV